MKRTPQWTLDLKPGDEIWLKRYSSGELRPSDYRKVNVTRVTKERVIYEWEASYGGHTYKDEFYRHNPDKDQWANTNVEEGNERTSGYRIDRIYPATVENQSWLDEFTASYERRQSYAEDVRRANKYNWRSASPSMLARLDAIATELEIAQLASRVVSHHARLTGPLVDQTPMHPWPETVNVVHVASITERDYDQKRQDIEPTAEQIAKVADLFDKAGQRCNRETIEALAAAYDTEMEDL